MVQFCQKLGNWWKWKCPISTHFWGEHWVLSGNSLDAVLLQELGEKPRRKKNAFPGLFCFHAFLMCFKSFDVFFVCFLNWICLVLQAFPAFPFHKVRCSRTSTEGISVVWTFWICPSALLVFLDHKHLLWAVSVQAHVLTLLYMCYLVPVRDSSFRPSFGSSSFGSSILGSGLSPRQFLGGLWPSTLRQEKQHPVQSNGISWGGISPAWLKPGSIASVHY